MCSSLPSQGIAPATAGDQPINIVGGPILATGSPPPGSELGKVRRNDANLAGSNRGPLLISESTRGKNQPMSSNTRMLLLSSNSRIEDVSPYFKTGQVVDVAEDSIKPSPELRRLLEQLDDDDGA
jgi:hypothetical protein